MKTEINTALGLTTPSNFYAAFGLGTDAGFRNFLSTSDTEEATSCSSGQPLRYLDSVPTLMDTQLDAPMASMLSVQESLSRALGSVLLLSAKPTVRAPSLSEAVQALKARLK